jgi:hypothetical protein
MTRNMDLPDNLIDQIHYDICHGLEGDILLTAAQIESLPELMGRKLGDGSMLLGRIIRESEVPNVTYPPAKPNEDWVVGGIRWK